MALHDRNKNPKARRPSPLGAKGRARREYLAKLVPLEAIREVVRAHGPGERVASWVAGQQLGLITSRQLRTGGISQHATSRRCKRCSLHRVHQGVYLYGSPIMLPGALEFAAVLACAPDAWICGRSALVLQGVLRVPGPEVEVLVVGRDCRSRSGIHVRRTQRLDRRDTGSVRGIPVTSPARALIEFAADAASDELERAIAEAYALRLVTENEIQAAMERATNHAGVAALRAELRRGAGPQWTRSESERRMLRLLRDARLPPPLTNVRVAGFEADFFWPDQKLIVEFDGYQFHGHRRAFEQDRRRDQAHIAAGYTVIRVTWRQLTEEPLAVVATISHVLARQSR